MDYKQILPKIHRCRHAHCPRTCHKFPRLTVTPLISTLVVKVTVKVAIVVLFEPMVIESSYHNIVHEKTSMAATTDMQPCTKGCKPPRGRQACIWFLLRFLRLYHCAVPVSEDTLLRLEIKPLMLLPRTAGNFQPVPLEVKQMHTTAHVYGSYGAR
jgi:hypothetical protein